MTNTIEKSSKVISRNKFDIRSISILIILIGIMTIVGIYNPLFLKWGNINGILQQVAPLGIVAIGSMFVLISGGIDFSAGNGLAMIGVFAGIMHSASGENILVLIVASMIGGLLLGSLNGLLITKLNMKPFIATLATMSITQGVSLLIAENRVAFLSSKAAFLLGGGSIFGKFSITFLIFLFLCAITHLILTRTKMGAYAYAIGGNEEAARYAGININKYKFMIYVFAGLCTGIGAALTICRVGQNAPNIAGSTLLDAISAAVIGGTSVSGGKGNISGLIIGVLIIGVISNALAFLNIPTTGQDVVKGFVILLALIANSFFNKQKKLIDY